MIKILFILKSLVDLLLMIDYHKMNIYGFSNENDKDQDVFVFVFFAYV